jgi:SAM-dependent methyltransferase
MMPFQATAQRWFWDLHSRTWDAWHDPQLPDVRCLHTLDWVARAAPGAHRILEVGCATGRQSIALANVRYAVIGVDVSAAMCRRAEANARGMAAESADVRFCHGDIERASLPWIPAVDVILCQGVLQCASSPKAFLMAAMRYLSPTGVMLIEVRDAHGAVRKRRPHARSARWCAPIKALCSCARSCTDSLSPCFGPSWSGPAWRSGTRRPTMDGYG